MLATYAVIRRVLNEIPQSFSETVESLLGLGAGFESAMWAASEVFTSLNQINLVEKRCSSTDSWEMACSESEVYVIQSAVGYCVE